MILCVRLLTGCQANDNCLEPISPASLSQNVYDDLHYEWDTWNSLSQEEKMVSGHLPGCCQRSFDDWAECEAFLGFSIPNPLEECTWLEQATYVGMPIGFQNTPCIKASWYGTEAGHVEWISVDSGYRNGDIRVIISAMLYGNPTDTKSSNSVSSVELERQNYLANLNDGPLQISSDCTANYYSNTAYQAYGNILYRFRVIGTPDIPLQVEHTMEQVVNAFHFYVTLSQKNKEIHGIIEPQMKAKGGLQNVSYQYQQEQFPE